MTDDVYLGSTHHTLAWFWKRIQANEVELQPAFQREGVWTDKQKSYLIDTMLRGLPVPEMYLQQLVDDVGNERVVVVDGQQRLRACSEFLNNQLTLIGEEVGGLAGKKFADLSPDDRQKLFAYKFVVRNLPLVDEGVLRDIFRRINKNTVTLNEQEIRHATYWGEFIKSAEFIANYPGWSKLGIFTPNDVRRMRHIEFVSEVMVARLYGDQDKKRNLEKAYQAFETEFGSRAVLQGSMLGALDWLVHFFPELSNTRWRKKSDFYTLFTVLSEKGFTPPRGGLPDRFNSEVVASALRKFASDVDARIFLGEGGDEGAGEYADAVERAASDIANRRVRRIAVEAVVTNAMKQVALAV